jgi:hypothetical protein
METAVSPAKRSDDAAEVYESRLRQLRDSQTREQRGSKYLGLAKLLVAGFFVIAGLSLLHYPMALGPLVLLGLAFVLLAVLHERVLRALRDRARAMEFYQRGVDRLNDRWPGSGETGERFLDPLHPYAQDLDIFGRASLFEYLCASRTRAGEETLAQWLLAPAPVAEIRVRQAAVAELMGRVEFREALWSLGETVRLGVQPDALAAWGERNPVAGLRSMQVFAALLASVWFFSLICWGVWGVSGFALAMTVVNFAYSYYLHRRLAEPIRAAETATRDLALLAEVLALFEREDFACPKLRQVQNALKRDGVAPSAAVRKLRRIAEYLESRRNPFARLPDLFTFWIAQLLFASERWRGTFGASIRCWLSAVGELEALASLSGYAYEHPRNVFPNFVEDGPLFDAEGFAHPLLPSRGAVQNDLRLGGGTNLIILSGPNMAGKSTFIRSIGVNVVLAQCGAPVRAESLTLSPLALGASICVLDSLNGGVSRFYAEISRIKLIADLAQQDLPMLFLLDELLSGTNSHDRLAGTQYIVRSLLERGALGIVSTHDLALTEIPDTMDGKAVNCHFEDSLEDGQLMFDYKLKPGIVQTSNALELMRSIGLGVKS